MVSGASGGYNSDKHLFAGEAFPNGNIAYMEWKSVNHDALNWYAYDYDALNRVVTATHNTGNYNMAVTEYDKNGNIKGLSRNGYLGGSFGDVDILDYDYSGNRLTEVTDTGHSSYGFKNGISNYVYDLNGNMISDSGKALLP